MEDSRQFGGIYCLHLQGLLVSQARYQHEAGSNLFICFLFGKEDGSYAFLRNVGLLSPDYTALYPGR
jgi:hypothetical protein